MTTARKIQLFGRVIIRGQIKALSGLHIGGSTTALEIGAVDLPVIRSAKNGLPYIPGSSLKGKMRSLAEKVTGAPQNKNIGKGVHIHVAADATEYEKYWVNPVFGVPSEIGFDISGPTRLVVRDVPLDVTSLDEAKGNLDQPFTEVKWENALDRVTSAATPRQIERVPAGAIFTPMELVFSLFEKADAERLGHVLTAMQLVEDDYLGGQGTRGSGKVIFESLELSCKVGSEYRDGSTKSLGTLADLGDTGKMELVSWAEAEFFSNGAS
jgi:CRISPR-associated protein Csm3